MRSLPLRLRGQEHSDSADEIPFLQLYPNFTYAADHLVHEIGRDGDLQVLRSTPAKASGCFAHGTVVLAAGTVATTALALGRIESADRPVRLLSNPTAATAFIIPRLIGSDPSQEAISLGQLFFRANPNPTIAAAGASTALKRCR